MSIDFTIAIPTYNGESRIEKMLDSLRSQLNISELNWEIVIVDNNSKDDTANIIKKQQESWNHAYPLKYYFEPQQGAAFARLRAVREAQGDIIGFLDDDNLPDANWISAAYSFAKEHPLAGAWSGQIHGSFEVEPPANFKQIQAFLAIREHGENQFLFQPKNLRLPPGAAIVVRRKAWIESVPPTPKLSGKLPGLMIQGDDYEPLLYLHKAGWEIWYHPQLHTYHQIPKWRLEKDYLLSLSRGCGLATCQLRMINAKSYEESIIITKTILGNLRRIIQHQLKYKQQIKTDIIAACELEFFIGSLISPIYYLKSKLKSNGN